MMKYFIYVAVSISFFALACNGSSNEATSSSKSDENEVKKEAALATLDSLIEVEPRNAEHYYNRAKYYEAKGINPKALADAFSALHLDSTNVKYIIANAELYIKNNEGDKALTTISRGINLNEDNEVLYEYAIEYNLYMQNYEAALNFANDLLRINKFNANAYFFKGLIFKETNNLNKAISNLQTCVELDPSYYNAYMQLALLFDAKNDPLATQYFDNAKRIEPNSREAIYGKAYFYQKNGQFNEAIKVYKEMVRENPKDHEVFFNIGHCYIDLDSLDKAYTNFDLAVKIQPQYTGAYYMKAYVSELKEDYSDALKNYNQAYKLLPKDSAINAAIDRIKSYF